MTHGSDQVRSQFLEYFGKRGHEVVPSSSLVPQNDPTLLFTNAGMVQFKDVFTGQATRAIARAASSQKCVRAGGKHNDLENVGRTARHLTFFEMLGNFSFGDYFKADAIAFAFELLTKGYGLDSRRFRYTVHTSDDEARALWKKVAGAGADKIVALGDQDNFWSMGETGPCGPCSEVHYHQGDDIPCAEAAAGRPCLGPACDCDRWVEIWNLVFMQFEQLPHKIRKPLPKPSVDTGMGLERLCAVLGGFRSNYETDLLRPLIDEAARLSGKPFAPADYEGASVSMRAMADHARTAAFLIADGVFPDKTGREYVLRRIMRRGVYHGWLIGVRAPFLARFAGLVVDGMGGVYPELRERRVVILKVADEEEKRFRETLERGVGILEEEFARLRNTTIPGTTAFRLYDTFGFPMDLTRVIAAGRGFDVDEAGFESAMDEQRKRGEFVGSGEAAVEGVWKAIAERVGPTRFLGYEATEASSEIVALVVSGKQVEAATQASPGRVAFVTRETPFYGEQGGQIGDAGEATGPRGAAKIDDCQRPVSALYVHFAAVASGEIRVGDRVDLRVDVTRRDAIRRNHSATHLVHWALRDVLGDHVAQKGSLVAPDRLRFDFSHFAPLLPEEKTRIEDLVNERIRANLPADTQILPIAEAKKAGAIAFFGEKYGDTVRVLSMAESKEFCGGTHVRRTGDIALFKITEETGIAQGVRRIEAVTGEGALAYLRRLESELLSAGEVLRGGPLEVAARIGKLQEALRERDKEIEKLRRRLATGGAADTTAEETVETPHGPVRVSVSYSPVADPKTLREMADRQREKKATVSLIVGREDGKAALVTTVSADIAGAFPAGKILGEIAKQLGGRGGGRPDMAQGGAEADKVPADPREMLSRVREVLSGK